MLPALIAPFLTSKKWVCNIRASWNKMLVKYHHSKEGFHFALGLGTTISIHEVFILETGGDPHFILVD